MLATSILDTPCWHWCVSRARLVHIESRIFLPSSFEFTALLIQMCHFHHNLFDPNIAMRAVIIYGSLPSLWLYATYSSIRAWLPAFCTLRFTWRRHLTLPLSVLSTSTRIYHFQTANKAPFSSPALSKRRSRLRTTWEERSEALPLFQMQCKHRSLHLFRTSGPYRAYLDGEMWAFFENFPRFLESFWLELHLTVRIFTLFLSDSSDIVPTSFSIL